MGSAAGRNIRSFRLTYPPLFSVASILVASILIRLGQLAGNRTHGMVASLCFKEGEYDYSSWSEIAERLIFLFVKQPCALFKTGVL